MSPADHSAKHPRSGGTKTDDTEFGRLVRLAVKAHSGYTGRDIAVIEEELAQEIAINARSFAHFYKGKASIDVRAIRAFLELGKKCRYLNRTWGEHLLRAAHYARYGDPATLLDQYWPPDTAHPPLPPRVFSNLPAPTYGAFVMRSAAYASLIEALNARTPLVVIVGLGGIGKTSLAREIAGQCLDRAQPAGADSLPRFNVAVWVSDKDAPGTTRLNAVLDEIAAILDYPEISRLDPARKAREIGHLLRAQRVLLVIDNFETITDPALAAWLLKLPEPSKALITSREYLPEFQDRGVWRVGIGRMSEQEGRQFIAQRNAQYKPAAPLDDGAQRQLVSATGGNPMAMHILLGLMRGTGRSAQEIIERIITGPHAALDALIATSWSNLNEAERQVLLALTFFSGSAGDQALAVVAGQNEGPYLDAIQRLNDLALIETEQDRTASMPEPRRVLHPLTRQFAQAQLREQGLFAAAAHARRVAWAIEFATTYGGHRPNEPETLRRLEAEEPTLWATFQWASDHGAAREVLILARQLEFYYYTRALWARKLTLHRRYIDAARQLGDPNEQINALALHIQLLSRQGHPEQAQDEIAELLAITRRERLQGASFFNAQHAQALVDMARGDLDAAAATWQQIIALRDERAVPERLLTGTQHWLALCRYRQGEQSEAHALLETSLCQAHTQGNPRRAARNQIMLALIELDQGQVDAARSRLTDAHILADDFDREQRAHYQHALGRLCAAEHDQPGARRALQAALELFERMGLEQEVREVRAGLAELSKKG